ncbi:MAG: class I SAM-dependent methyltransferase [Deltaproteobacteria bacterium]|nr:class I SAM-dependent methyltransferase [Candidatus Anaeroferrophillus wilburensis]MBN2889688.1 class I SAM-dependent methyltransferase [Deltaproteobacteria bacterium]
MKSNQQILQSYPCLLCGRNDFIHVIDWTDRHSQPVSLSVCKTCGLRQLNPRMDDEGLTQFYSSNYYKQYSMDKKSENPTWVKRKHRIAKEILDAVGNHRLLQGLRLLDIGCGHGFLITEAKTRGASVSGIEPSVRHAKRLQERGFDVYSGSLEQYATDQPGSYDIVTCSHVLEHSENPGKFLQCAGSLLARDGLLCAEVPNAEWQTNYGKHPVSIHTAHLCYHTERSLRALFEISGLSVLSTSYGLHGGSVRVVSSRGFPKDLLDMELDDPEEIRRKTLLAFKRHTAPQPVRQFWYALRMTRKGIVKWRFKRAQNSS